LVRLLVPKEIRDEVRGQPARKRYRRKLRIASVSEFFLLLVWFALIPVSEEVFVILAAALVITGVFSFIWTWGDLKEMREFEKALWAKYESEHRSVNAKSDRSQDQVS
jgi:hypothetical protein